MGRAATAHTNAAASPATAGSLTDVGDVRDVTGAVAEWAATSRFSDVPQQVLDAARRLALDGFGCSLFGVTVPWTQPVLDLATSSGTGAEATIWGAGRLVPAVQAPLANGTTMHAFEADDLHPGAALHGAAQALPAAMAIVELRKRGPAAGARPEWLPREPASEQELLHAFVVGLEVGAAIGLTTGSAQLLRGFHPSPNTGTFSAAVTAGRLLGFDAEQMRNALGIAGSFGGYLMAAQYGAAVKRVHPGRSAQAGTTAALLAARGLTGISNVLEAPYGGFGRAFAGVEPDQLRAIPESLGRRWETPNFTIKAYPCCGSNHTSIDALLSMRAEDGLDPDQIASITVRCSTITADHVGWPYRPTSVTAAQMNLAYTLAALVADGQVSVEQYREERIADPRLIDLAARVRVEVDPEIDALGRDMRHAVEVTVESRDGTRRTRRVDHPRGSVHRPLSDDEVIEKFQSQAAASLAEEAADEIVRIVRGLAGDGRAPGTQRVDRLIDLLGGRESPSS